MSSRAFVLTVAVMLAAPLSAQQNLHSRLAPISAPVRRAGVYHVATGTWTRHASLANVTGPDIIYNNTCAAIYYSPMQLGDVFQHHSRIPSTTGPTTPSVFYGPPENDEAPGCRDSYPVNGFEIAYCSSAASTVDWQYEFASSYSGCAGPEMIPQYSVLVTGLPGGAAGGAQACWTVDVDLSGNSGGGIVMSADGDGTYGVGTDTFGFGFGPASAVALSDSTGPLIAGDLVWTGGPVVGPLTPCTGTDGTIWDNPINLGEPGTGMTSADFFRVAAGSVTVPPGCYSMGGTPHADFYLELFANPQCSGQWGPDEFCFPGQGGIKACTTCSPANPPSSHDRGCNNFGNVTGGAHLTATGIAQASHSTIVFTSLYENDTALTVIMHGTTTANLVFGAGIRCVGGNLKRLYTGPAGAIANGDAPETFHRPGPVDPTSVVQASLNRGYDILAHAPVTLYYQVQYRDPNASTHCGGATFNSSQALALNWVP